jgi:hypothetical protein
MVVNYHSKKFYNIGPRYCPVNLSFLHDISDYQWQWHIGINSTTEHEVEQGTLIEGKGSVKLTTSLRYTREHQVKGKNLVRLVVLKKSKNTQSYQGPLIEGKAQ